jgi:hypothetical protein
MSRSLVAVSLAVLSLCACTQNRRLWISEVGAQRLELYLDEPNGNALALPGQTLDWVALDPSGMNAPQSGSVDLAGSIPGGGFLVLFEDPSVAPGGATPATVDDFFHRSRAGLAVAPNALGPTDPMLSYAFRVHGHEFRYIFPFFYTYDDTDDTVRFGPPGRPNIGGAFSEDGSLQPVTRTPTVGQTKGRTIRRKTTRINGVETPADRDREADWKPADESWGSAK